MLSVYVPDDVVTALDGRRSALLVSSYLLAFFDSYVKGLPRAPLLDEIPSRYEEVRFFSRAPAPASRN